MAVARDEQLLKRINVNTYAHGLEDGIRQCDAVVVRLDWAAKRANNKLLKALYVLLLCCH